MSRVECNCSCSCNCNSDGIGNLTKEEFFDLLDEWWMYKCMKESGFSREEADDIKNKQKAYAREDNVYAQELKRMKYKKEQQEFYRSDKIEYNNFVKENNVVDVIAEEEKRQEEARLKEEKEQQKREERSKTFGGKILNFLDDMEKANTPEAKAKREYADYIRMTTGRVLTGEELDREWESQNYFNNSIKLY